MRVYAHSLFFVVLCLISHSFGTQCGTSYTLTSNNVGGCSSIINWMVNFVRVTDDEFHQLCSFSVNGLSVQNSNWDVEFFVYENLDGEQYGAYEKIASVTKNKPIDSSSFNIDLPGTVVLKNNTIYMIGLYLPNYFYSSYGYADAFNQFSCMANNVVDTSVLEPIGGALASGDISPPMNDYYNFRYIYNQYNGATFSIVDMTYKIAPYNYTPPAKTNIATNETVVVKGPVLLQGSVSCSNPQCTDWIMGADNYNASIRAVQGRYGSLIDLFGPIYFTNGYKDYQLYGQSNGGNYFLWKVNSGDAIVEMTVGLLDGSPSIIAYFKFKTRNGQSSPGYGSTSANPTKTFRTDAEIVGIYGRDCYCSNVNYHYMVQLNPVIRRSNGCLNANATCNCSMTYSGPVCSQPTTTGTTTGNAASSTSGVIQTTTGSASSASSVSSASSSSSASSVSSASSSSASSASGSSTTNGVSTSNSVTDGRNEINQATSSPGVTVLVGAIVGPVIAVLLIGFGILAFIVFRRRKNFRSERRSMATESNLKEDSPETDVQMQSVDVTINKIDPDEIEIKTLLGKGNFGEVFKGDWNGTPVALKKLKDVNLFSEFMKEFEVLSNVNHPHIIRLLGQFTDSTNSNYLVLEFAAGGSLDSWVQKNQEKINHRLTLNIASQVCAGMVYLEKKKLVHRDLALRNILVSTSTGNDISVKISDLGMSRSDEYVASASSKVPIRWTAPEVLKGAKASNKSDVWAFGVFVWELATGGGKPYNQLNNRDVVQYVTSGKTLEKPEKVSDNFYALLLHCWSLSPDNRPSFKELILEIERIEPDYEAIPVTNSTKADLYVMADDPILTSKGYLANEENKSTPYQ